MKEAMRRFELTVKAIVWSLYRSRISCSVPGLRDSVERDVPKSRSRIKTCTLFSTIFSMTITALWLHVAIANTDANQHSSFALLEKMHSLAFIPWLSSLP